MSSATMHQQSGQWQNWAKTQTCVPSKIFYPETCADLVAIVKHARREGKRVRAAGQGHTMGPMSITDDYLVMIERLNKIGPVQADQGLITFEAGVSVAELDRALCGSGL